MLTPAREAANIAEKKTPVVSGEVLDQLLDGQNHATVLSDYDLTGELKQALAEAGWLVRYADGYPKPAWSGGIGPGWYPANRSE